MDPRAADLGALGTQAVAELCAGPVADIFLHSFPAALVIADILAIAPEGQEPA